MSNLSLNDAAWRVLEASEGVDLHGITPIGAAARFTFARERLRQALHAPIGAPEHKGVR